MQGQHIRHGFALDNPDNLLDRMSRKLEFGTWLVARRKGAALARDSTEFLAGVHTTLALDASVVARPAGGSQVNFSGSGTWALTSTPARDASNVRLSGAVPGEFEAKFRLAPGGTPLFNEFLRSEEKVPGRDANQGLGINEWRAQVRKIADAHRMGKPGVSGPLFASVRIDLATGRVILDDPATLAADAVSIRASGSTPVTPQDAKQLAIDMFPEVRKLVIGFIPNAQTQNSGVIPILVSLSRVGV